MGLILRNPVFGGFVQVRQKNNCPNIEASSTLDISDLETGEIMQPRENQRLLSGFAHSVVALCCLFLVSFSVTFNLMYRLFSVRCILLSGNTFGKSCLLG